MINKELNSSELDIDILNSINKIYKRKKTIIIISLIGLIMGIVVAFSLPSQYTTTVLLTSESSKSTKENMGTLASMAGINLGMGSNSETLTPELYPDILYSTPFIKGLFNIKVIDSNQNVNATLYDYFKDNQKSPWWNNVFKIPALLFSNDEKEEVHTENTNNRFISHEESNVINIIRSSYNINTSQTTGVTTIEVLGQSPVITAYLADTIASYLQKFIIDKRTQKARTDLENTERLYKKAKTDYYNAQQNLASFMDGNMNIVSARFRINQKKMENEVDLAYSVYTQMAQQVQLNRMKVQDDTPVFTIIQPAIEPLYATGPQKKLIIIVFTLLSFVGSTVWILGKSYIKSLKDKLNNTNKE